MTKLPPIELHDSDGGAVDVFTERFSIQCGKSYVYGVSSNPPLFRLRMRLWTYVVRRREKKRLKRSQA